MSFVLVAISPAHAYSKYTQNKALKEQTNAINAAREADARKAAEAETSAQVAANAKTAEAKRRRRGTALSLGGEVEALGGAPATALGAMPAPRGGGMAGQVAATALGSAYRSNGGGSYGVAGGAYKPGGKVAVQ